MINYQDFMNNGQSQSGAPMMDTVRDELGNTLRSVRDTLAISFQTLNLTLSSVNNTMRTMSASMTPSFMTNRDPSIVPAGTHGSSFLGSLSNPMAQAIGSSSMLDLMTMRKPFNVSSYEWSQQSNRELGYRATGLGTDMTLGLASIGATMGASYGLERGGMAAARRFAPGMVKGMSSLPGRLAMGIGAWNVASLAIEPIVSGIAEQADEYQQDYAGLRRMSPRFGNEFSLKQARSAAKGLNSLAHTELMQSGFNDTKLGLDGYRSVAMQGMQMNMFQGQSPDELIKQVASAGKVVKFLTGILGNKDITETMEAVGQLKSMGVNVFKDPGFASKLGNAAFAKGTTMGVQPAQLLKTAIESSAGIYGQHGLPSFGGIMPMMNNLSIIHQMEKSRYLTAGEIAAGGGHQGIAREYAGHMASMISDPGLGGVVRAAGMDKYGNFNQGLFNQAMKGNGMNLVNQGAGSLLGSPQAMFHYQANSTKMQEQMMKAHPGGAENAMERALGSYMDMMPFADQGGYEDKIDFYAAMYKQKFPGASDATAKMFARKHLNPGLNNMSSEKDAMRTAAWNRHTASSSRFSSYRRGAENLSKVPSRISNWVKKNVTHPLVDTWSDIVGENDKAPGFATMSSGELGSNALVNAALKDPSLSRADPRTTSRSELAGIERENNMRGTKGSSIWSSSLLESAGLENPFGDYSQDALRGSALVKEGNSAYYNYANDPGRESYDKMLARGDYQEFLGRGPLGTLGDQNGLENEFKDYMKETNGQYRAMGGVTFLLEKDKKKVAAAEQDFINSTKDNKYTSGLLSGNLTKDKAQAQANLARGDYDAEAKKQGMSAANIMRIDMQNTHGANFAKDDILWQGYAMKDIGKYMKLGAGFERGVTPDSFETALADSQVSLAEMNKAAQEFEDGGLDMKQLAKARSSASSDTYSKDMDTLVDMIHEGKGNGNHVFVNKEFEYLYGKNREDELRKLRKGNETKEQTRARLDKANMSIVEGATSKNISDLEGMDFKTSTKLTEKMLSGDMKGAKEILDGDKTASGAHNALIKDLVNEAASGPTKKSMAEMEEFVQGKLGKSVDLSNFKAKSADDLLKKAVSYSATNAGETEAAQKDMMDKEKISHYADGNRLRVVIDPNPLGAGGPSNEDTRASWADSVFDPFGLGYSGLKNK